MAGPLRSGSPLRAANLPTPLQMSGKEPLPCVHTHTTGAAIRLRTGEGGRKADSYEVTCSRVSELGRVEAELGSVALQGQLRTV